MSFLYDTLVQEFGKREIARVPVLNYITDNLKPGYGPLQPPTLSKSIYSNTPEPINKQKPG